MGEYDTFDGPVAAKSIRDYGEPEQSDARISAQLGHMHDQLEKTQALVSELEMRIDLILMPEESSANHKVETGAVPRLPASELSKNIDDLNSNIGYIQQRILRITKRVQL